MTRLSCESEWTQVMGAGSMGAGSMGAGSMGAGSMGLNSSSVKNIKLTFDCCS